MDALDFSSTETKKEIINTNFSRKFDSRLVFLIFLMVCTAYALGAFH
jgi:hypothetical protein